MPSLLSWLLPFTCILCGQRSDRSQDLCQGCWDALPHWHDGCPRCANPLRHAPANTLCGACQTKPPPFRHTFALFFYRAPIVHLITQLKFQHAFIHARVLAEHMREKILTDWYRNTPLPSAILPVPLHPSRQRSRGFNQTVELARHLGLPILVESCQRRKPTRPQTDLKGAARRANLRDAFVLDERFIQRYQGRSIAVLDDVITTGNTVRVLCELLTRHNIGPIDVWCCARQG